MSWPLAPMSSSAVDSYATCPLQWSLRYGPGRAGRKAGSSPDDALHVSRRRGRVVHAGICTALRAAQVELAERGTAIPGTLRRYHTPARIELGKAWQAEQMPSDPAEGQFVTDLFERTLDAVPIPRPGSIYGIEQRYEHVTAEGVPVAFVPDYTFWSRPGALVIVDWKTGKVATEDVPRHQQLLRYAAWMAQRDPAIKSVEIELFAMRDGVGHRVRVDPDRAARAAARFDRLAWKAAADREFLPKIGGHCGGCAHRLACPTMRARLGGPNAA